MRIFKIIVYYGFLICLVIAKNVDLNKLLIVCIKYILLSETLTLRYDGFVKYLIVKMVISLSIIIIINYSCILQQKIR